MFVIFTRLLTEKPYGLVDKTRAMLQISGLKHVASVEILGFQVYENIWVAYMFYQGWKVKIQSEIALKTWNYSPNFIIRLIWMFPLLRHISYIIYVAIYLFQYSEVDPSLF